MNLKIGATGHAELTVQQNDLATIWNQDAHDTFPPVFATAHMIGLMELAASRVLHSLLKEGEGSVGASVDVAHTAPTPPGAKVMAQAHFTGMDGKFYVFEVVAHDTEGEIGRGTHKRAIVATQRLLDGAAHRHSTF